MSTVTTGPDREAELVLQRGEELTDIPHACEPEEGDEGADELGGARRQRLIGIDAARGLALLGMVAVHVYTADAGNGSVSVPWLISSGASSATFAVLGGIGLAFMSGRTSPERAPVRISAIRIAVRAALILAIGLLLGLVVPVDTAGVILPYLGLLFLMAVPVIRLRPRTLFLLAAGWLFASPVLSHLLRQSTPAFERLNLSPGDLVTDPAGSVLALAVTGLYPALTWFTYILLGLGLGRLALDARRYAVVFAVAGGALSLGAILLSALLLGPVGGLDRLARGVEGTMTLDEFTSLLTWGSDGTLPATSWWWMASDAPHTGTPLDLLRTCGIALLVLGVCLMAASALPRGLRLLSAPGSMTLTLYSGHLLLLLLPLGGLPEHLQFLFHVAVLTSFGVVWQRHRSRGPLEAFVASACRRAAPTPGRHRIPR